MGTRDLYESVWRDKLQDPEWLARDVSGRVEQACDLLKRLGRLGESRILDVGCGRGTLGRRLGKSTGMFGLDISELAVAKAREVYEDARRVNLDEDNIPFERGSFDVAVMLDVIEQVLDPRAALAKVCSILKPGGQLILTTPNILWWRRLWYMISRRSFPRTGNDKYGYDGGDLHSFSVRDICGLAAGVGFGRVENVGSRTGKILADFRGADIWLRGTR